MTRAALAILVLLTLAACASDPRSGYTFASAWDESIETVAVPMFDNVTFSHGMEVALTDAVVKQIQARTPWRVTSQETADTTLTAVIRAVDIQRLSTARVSGLSEQVALEVTIDFEWKDNASGRVLAARRDFRASEAFIPAQGVGERIELAENAAVEEIARDIVDALRSGW